MNVIILERHTKEEDPCCDKSGKDFCVYYRLPNIPLCIFGWWDDMNRVIHASPGSEPHKKSPVMIWGVMLYRLLL